MPGFGTEVSDLAVHPIVHTRHSGIEIGTLGRTREHRLDTRFQQLIPKEIGHCVTYLTARSKVLALRKDALVIVDIILPAVLCSVFLISP